MVVVTAAVALAASTRFGQVMTLAICTAVLGVGIVSDYAFGQHEETSLLAAGVYRFLPNMGPFWVVDGLSAGTEKTTVPGKYVALATCYAGLLTIAILNIAIAAFQKREVG